MTTPPRIVTARPPRRTQQPKATPKAKAGQSIVGRHGSPVPDTPEDHQARGDAADALFREILRRVKESR